MRKDEKPYIPEPGKTYESDDLKLGPVMKGLLWFFGLTAASGILAALVFQFLVPGGFGSTTGVDPLHRRLPPEPLPRIQSGPAAAADIANLRNREQAKMNSSSWVDRAHGIARIPIEEAMERVAKEGLPHWTAREPTARTAQNGVNP